MVTRSVLMVNDPFLVVSGESLGDVRRESSTRPLGNGRGRGRRSPRAGGSVSPPLLEALGGSRDGSLPVAPSVPEVVSGIGTVLISSAVQAPVNDVGGATIIPPVSIRPPPSVGPQTQPAIPVCQDRQCETCMIKGDATIIPQRLCCPVDTCDQHGKVFYPGPGVGAGFRWADLGPLRTQLSICRSLIQNWPLFTLGKYFCLSIFGWHIVQDLHVELFVGSKPICRGFVVTPNWIVHGMK